MRGLDIRFDKSLKVGNIISSIGEQIAVADMHEVYKISDERDISNRVIGGWVEVGNKQPCIRISQYGNKANINTNFFKQSGIVCFLPIQFNGRGIISVKITELHRQSVNAIPLDYIEVPGEKISSGYTGSTFKETKAFFPNAERKFQGVI